jgi:archaemetzincin
MHYFILFIITLWIFTLNVCAAGQNVMDNHMLLTQNFGASPDELQAAFAADVDFRPIPSPQPGDWLAVHREPGQTFEEFVNARPPRPDPIRHIIYLQPLEQFVPDRSPSLQLLQEYMRVYFALEVQVLPVLMQDKQIFTTRINPSTNRPQILTTDILRALKKTLPADAFCLLAITMQDLYPDPSWNFVFGQASPEDRVGVFSFARYDPAFYGSARTAQDQPLLLKRSCKVLSHETGHIFGLWHCIFYACVMNGSNHLAESDARPMYLCPECLRKLYYSIRFDPIDRYRKLQTFYQKVGFDKEARWVQHRLKKITGKER